MRTGRRRLANVVLEAVNIERHRGDGDSMHEKAIAMLESLREQREAIIAFPDDEWQRRYEERRTHYLMRQEDALARLWAKEITHEEFFEQGEA